MAEHIQQFLIHLNSLNPHIQFTTESLNEQGTLPLLDTLVSAASNGSLATSFYRKPTNREQYLHLDSHHIISTKYSVCAQTGSYLDRGQQHIRTALGRCNYPDWVFHRLKAKLDFQLSIHNHNTNSYTQKDMDNKTKTSTWWSLKSVCKKAGFQDQFKEPTQSGIC